jgi:hypothetical protein
MSILSYFLTVAFNFSCFYLELAGNINGLNGFLVYTLKYIFVLILKFVINAVSYIYQNVKTAQGTQLTIPIILLPVYTYFSPFSITVASSL